MKEYRIKSKKVLRLSIRSRKCRLAIKRTIMSIFLVNYRDNMIEMSSCRNSNRFSKKSRFLEKNIKKGINKR